MIRKLITIAIDMIGGAIVVSVGLSMLPFPYNLVWGTFNLYIWIVAPILLLKANKNGGKKA